MRRTRRPPATWTGRFLRGRLLDRNPLRRGSDRLETAIFAVLLVVVCVTAPFLAVAASGWENSTSLREMRAQQATCREVRATLLDDAQITAAYPVRAAEADIRWTAPDGRMVIALAGVPAGAEAGSKIWIWTNRSGQLITPLLPAEIPARDGLAATAAVTSLSTLALLAGLVARRTLNRHRM